MTLKVSHAKPSTLADVLRQVTQAFDAFGDATPILVGRKYLEDFGAGSGPRVVFVPERSGGAMGDPQFMGDAASMQHSCEVYVRAAESGDDLDRLAATYALSDLVTDCIETAAPGRITWGRLDDDSPVDVDVFGAGLKWTFFYERAILHDARRWSIPAATTDTSLRQGALDPGATYANSVKIVPTTIPETP
jgi:hypothetical protein